MPINSKYSNEQVESLISDLLAVLTRSDASIELSLMCLGNATSHIINKQIPKSQQKNVINTFNEALNATVKGS
ncbi:MAG: hypothetical protein ACI9FJ_002241 [Alteromonadaceae bacterium]|jgi:uncharacterized protein YejL (UPF0352 family)